MSDLGNIISVILRELGSIERLLVSKGTYIAFLAKVSDVGNIISTLQHHQFLQSVYIRTYVHLCRESWTCPTTLTPLMETLCTKRVGSIFGQPKPYGSLFCSISVRTRAFWHIRTL